MSRSLGAVAPAAVPRGLGRARALTRHGHLAIILVGHVLLGLAYGLAAPLLEAPDELGHFGYVRFLQTERRFPVQGADIDAPRAHHPPGYYLLGALLTAGVPIEDTAGDYGLALNPHFGFRQGDRASLDNRAVYVHHGPAERFPFQGWARSLHLLRLLSLGFSAVGVAATYGAARQLRPAQPGFAALAASLVAFNPIVLFTSGLVYNDTAALAAGAAVVYALSLTARRGFSPGRWLGVGLVLALGLLLKSSLLVLALPAGLLLAAQAWRARQWRATLGGGVGLAVPPLVLAGWWYARNARLYGDWTANTSIGWLNGFVPAEERLARLPGNVAWLLQSMFGCGPLGPESLCYPPVIMAGALGLALLAAAGAVLALRRWQRSRPAWNTTTRLWAVHGVVISALGASAVVYALTYRNTWQGRLWLPAFPSLAMLAAAGLLAWLPAHRQALGTAGLGLLATAVGAYGLFGLVVPAYAIPRAPWPLELRTAQPVEAQVGDAARVLGYRYDRQQVSGGQRLSVTVYWQILARTPAPYTVFVHLYAPAVGSLAQRDTYPGLGSYATTVWDPGRVFVDTYRLYLPDEVPAAEALVVLGLYDAATGERLPVTGASAGAAENNWVALGSVRVR